jgi:hypothetical protein
MAVVVPKVHGTKFSNATGFYRVEDFNLGYGTGVYDWVAANITFANAGNVKGVVFSAYARYALTQANYGIVAALATDSQTITSTNATTEKFNKVAHGLSDGDIVAFQSSANMPGGITANKLYYVVNKTDNDFQVSLTSGGAAVLLSSAHTGTLTCWRAAAWHVMTKEETSGDLTGMDNYVMEDYLTCDFDTFRTGTSLAVTTDAAKYKLFLNTAMTGFGGADEGTDWLFIKSGNGTTDDNTVFGIWCDNEVALSDDDTLIVTRYTIIDASKSLKGTALAESVTLQATALIVCGDKSGTYPYMLELENSTTGQPAASYTLTIKDMVSMGNFSGWRAGSASYPVSVAKQFNVVFTLPSLGTITDRTASIRPIRVSSNDTSANFKLSFYGAYPTKKYTRLVNTEDAGATVLEVEDDMTSEWSAGDKVYVSKLSSNGANYTFYTIDSLTSNSITLTTGLGVASRLSGGLVVKTDAVYGIKFTGVAGILGVLVYGCSPILFTLSGVYFEDFRAINTDDNSIYLNWKGDLASTWTTDNCFFLLTVAGTTGVYANFAITDKGFSATNYICLGLTIIAAVYKIASKAYKYFSGQITLYNGVELHHSQGAVWSLYSQTGLLTFNVQNIILHDRSTSSTSPTFPYFEGVGCTYKNIEIYKRYTSTTYMTGIQIRTLLNPVEISNIKVNGCNYGFYIAALTTVGVNLVNCTYGDELGILGSVYIEAAALADVHFDNLITGGYDVYTDNLDQTIEGTKVAFTKFNGTTGDDRTYQTYGLTQRCGTGLTDTTTLVSTDTYSVRMKPDGSSTSFAWEQNVPTGNIQNKDMQISVWVKINHANYYAGTHRLPRLTVTYDGSSTIYCQAAESTDAQKLFVNFTPLTTTGKITIRIGGYTDATGSDAYFYFGHFGILYPTGYVLDLADLDNWDRGLPVTPTISTVQADAGSLWDALTANHAVTGSFGAKTTSLKNASYIVDGEVII